MGAPTNTGAGASNTTLQSGDAPATTKGDRPLSFSEKPNTAAPYLAPGPGPENATLTEGSTRAPSLVDYPEKKVDDTLSTSGNETDNATVVADTGAAGDGGEVVAEYPKGVALTFIIVALVLSIFLVALDIVSFLHISGPPPSNQLTLHP